ncbi:MAG: hypothetical protein ACTJLL_03680 [Anaplasma sp.]
MEASKELGTIDFSQELAKKALNKTFSVLAGQAGHTAVTTAEKAAVANAAAQMGAAFDAVDATVKSGLGVVIILLRRLLRLLSKLRRFLSSIRTCLMFLRLAMLLKPSLMLLRLWLRSLLRGLRMLLVFVLLMVLKVFPLSWTCCRH